MIQNKKCLLFKNAQVVSDGKVQSKDVVVFRDKFVKTPPKDCEIIEVDCEGRYLMPGFIDIHVHGGGNCDFMDGNPASVRTVALTHLAHGTTTMMPTLLTASHEEILAALAAYNAATEQDALLRSIFYGVHMEGPYLSKNQKGAQDESYIKDFTGREYEIYYHLCREIKRWSMLCCSSPPRIKTGIAFFRFLLIISSTEKGKGRRQIDLSRHTSFVRRLRLRSTLRSLKRIVGIMFNGRRL